MKAPFLFPLDQLTSVDAAIAKPFIKWAGGKQAISSTLTNYFPDSYGKYFEPFIGGGSVFFSTQPQDAVIGDLNTWLVDTYVAIRDSWEDVATILDSMPNTKEDFLRVRSIAPSGINSVQRAAHFIYLNKTCFRGLFRVNRKGQFNVPYGEYSRRYYSPENLAAVSVALAKVEIRNGDYELVMHDVSKDDFAYFDPPYYKIGGYSDFNRYTAGQFNKVDHMRLAAYCRELDRRSVKWALSNSNTDLVRKLYSGFNFKLISNRREINLNSKKRNIEELLITNY